MLVDDFNDGVLAAPWSRYENTYARISEANGRLTITYAQGRGGSQYAGYQSEWRYALQDSFVVLQVLEVPNAATEASVSLTVSYGDPADPIDLRFQYRAGTTRALIRNNAGPDTNLAEAPYPTSGQWWRIRESAGAIHWEVSGDGASWVPFAQSPTPAELGLVQVEISGGTYQQEVDPGVASVDNLNVGTTPGAWCPIRTFTDDFGDAQFLDGWPGAWQDTGTQLVQSGGVVSISPAASRSAYAELRSQRLFDLTDSSVSVEVVSMLNSTASGEAYIELEAEDGQKISVWYNDGDVKGSVGDSSAPSVFRFPYNPASHRWWRIRLDGDILVFDFAGPSGPWVPMYSFQISFPVQAVEVVLGAGTYQSESVPGTVVFDNLNVGGPP